MRQMGVLIALVHNAVSEKKVRPEDVFPQLAAGGRKKEAVASDEDTKAVLGAWTRAAGGVVIEPGG